jgi:hypothetical protein
MFAAGKAVSGATPTDAQFNYVTMLLHGDGTNGAQNNTFVDSSTNNFTITRNGNTTQGTFSPYGSNWSSYLNGSSYFNVGSTRFLDASAWTVEMWINTTNTAQFVTLAAQYINTGGGFSARTVLGINSSTGTIAIFQGGTLQSGTTNICNGQWNHVAFVLSSGTVKAYVNGVNEATFTGFGTPTAITTLFFNDGYNSTSYYIGYASNLRVTNTAVYTTTFTPSITNLTAITGTQLLTLQSNRFIDNSTNAYTLSIGGTPSVQRFSPFSPTSAYSTSVIGGSGYFDGSGDNLQAPSSANFNLEGGSYTVELYVYFISRVAGTRTIVFEGTSTTVGIVATGTGNNDLDVNLFGTGSILVGSGVLAGKDNQWLHICLVSNGTNRSLFLNGTRVATTTSSLLPASNCSVGLGGNTVRFAESNLNGYISNARVVKGTAVYDPTASTLTVPTTPLTAVTNTQLLTNFTNAGILDNAMMNDLETVGNAQISTSVKKYGTGSLYFDGSGDYLTTPLTPNLQFGTGNFTVECWTNLVSRVSAYPCVWGNYNSYTTSALSLFAGHSSGDTSKYQVGVNGASFPVIQSTDSIVYNTWVHLAVVRNGGVITLYVNGVANGTYSFSGALNGVGPSWCIGTAFDAIANGYLNGYIDDLRITKGVARYTANFSVPTAAFPDKG